MADATLPIDLLRRIAPKSRVMRELTLACKEDDAELVQRLVDTFAVTSADVVAAKYAMFYAACKYGQFAIARWLMAALKFPPDAQRDRRALRVACKHGQLVVARWLVAQFGLKHTDARGALHTACARGHLGVAQWLVARFDLTEDHIHDPHGWVLDCACRWHPAVADWLLTNYGRAVVDIGCAHRALIAACEVGRLELAKRIAAMYAFEVNEIFKAGVIRAACDSGTLDVAQWATAQFGVTVEHVRTVDALIYACVGGRLAIAQWLVATFRLTDADTKSVVGDALLDACVAGHLAVAQWLVVTFDLRESREYVPRAFTEVCLNSHLEVARWLAATFELTNDDATSAMRSSVKGGPVAAWLSEHFGVAPGGWTDSDSEQIDSEKSSTSDDDSDDE